ncbi:hypothetical protein TBLA_0C04560 [Henningerozyma blattae CBS 6284]|uniref:GH16 domain-containing protein n=1 Tax=Henningerozyma blattae (strain ATCC 34711 / CBS 6284 / DSM 70876 / NBRC 10599 / NRRL Y-10934 / UCD 77-7) TaxID=1071380 RepID=I2H1K1_HENB6|nr:hypothetical protein TBLA_0C04560 [Tetrapisispora blattae CBS 6284]CCH60253.1 hypothetical protein TBLA_0C04560 [Tetrapisispora blattae CBS 6284]
MSSRRQLTNDGFSNPHRYHDNEDEVENIFATPQQPAAQGQTPIQNPFIGSDEEYDSYSGNYQNEDDLSETSLMHNNRNIINGSKPVVQHIYHDNDDEGDSRMSSNVQDYQGYYSRSNLNLLDSDKEYLNTNAIARNNSSYLNLESTKTPNLQGKSALVVDASNNNGVTNNDILSPPEFDRYPLISNSKSSQNLANGYYNGNSSSIFPTSATFGGNSPMLGSTSDISSLNGNNNEHDFSPFGGYPASSFPLLIEENEDDDYLHNPDPEEEAKLDKHRLADDIRSMDRRAAGGCVGLLFLLIAAVCIFVVLPALTFTGVVNRPTNIPSNSTYAHGKQEYLTDYEYPQLAAIRTELVDPDTPKNARSRKARDGSYWGLVFSDEFNAEGRTFYDGDDQYWTAPDIHYDATKDLEWYSPDASITRNGTLQLRMDAYKNHDLYYRSGMVQSWNKLCFTQGAIEISANLANYGRVTGLWPGLWTMGNLARPGFLASTEGVWPYAYDSCDAGITPNQSSPDGISYLPGQRLSVCTCDGEDHPNQGTGRGAPEIDIIEGEADTTLGVGIASQSMQIAPFDIWYIPDYDFVEIYNFTVTTMNTYCGGPFQQAVSAVSTLNTTWYQFGPQAGYYQKYAIELLNDDEEGYCRWFVGDNPTFTIHAKALHPNGNIGWRRISKEPMSIIMNLGISNNWAYIDWQSIYFPVTMSIDYVRIYQPNNSVSITCDPKDYPTYDYIQDHIVAYTNPNLTSWSSTGFEMPKNILTGNCKSSKYSLDSGSS